MIQTEIKRSLSQRISQPFITGALGFLPLALTLAILAWVGTHQVQAEGVEDATSGRDGIDHGFTSCTIMLPPVVLVI